MTPDPKIITAVEDILIRQLESLPDQDDLTRTLILNLSQWSSGSSPINDFETVRVLELLLMQDDRGPDHAAYLVDLVKGYGTWSVGMVGRIGGVLAALQALPWQRACALACTYDHNLHKQTCPNY